jgi:phosphoribosylformimino-5-aminoimidazole carboxamide ribotide isomerase
VRVAQAFAAAGTRWIHVVDLDAARTGERVNLGVVEAICAAVTCSIQASGGVRSVEAGGDLLAAGAARVVVGTGAIERPELVGELATLHPGRVAVGLDARGRDVAVRGWIDSTGEDLLEVAAQLDESGASALVVTEIGRDGTMAGPALDQLGGVLEVTSLPVIASGGVGGLPDLLALRRLRAGGRALAGVIVGRAIYEGRFGVDEALAAAASPP